MCTQVPPDPDLFAAANVETRRLRSALAEGQGTPHMRKLAHVAHEVERGVTVAVCEIHRLFHAVTDEQGYIPGMCVVGHMFDTGTHFPPCAHRARWLFERDIERYDCDVARFALAENLVRVQHDVRRAAELYEAVLRDSGFNVAARKLAELLDSGANGVERDCRKAVQLYWRAIEAAGSIEAMFNLARIYDEGREDVPQNLQTAVLLYERAIQEGRHTNAMNSLALLLQDGAPGVEMDVQRAVSLFERAIEKDGNSSAMNNLAFLISEGYQGVQRDMRKVVRLYEQACEVGNKVATRNLARLLQRGDDGVPVDKGRALELFERLQFDEEMFKTVRFEVALLLSGGEEEGVKQNTVRAAKIYEQIISEESNVSAMFNLACMLSEARGDLQRDNERAVALYERAILEGQDVFSMLNLGILLGCANEGIEKDKERAVELLEQALREGRKDANYHLAVVLVGFDGEPVDVKRSIQLFEKAIEELDHIGAMIDLSVLIGEGLHGVEQDVNRALRLSERAIMVGLENNQDELEQLGINYDNTEKLKDDADSIRERKHSIGRGSHLISMLNLAELLLSGNVTVDVDRALKLCERALTDSKTHELCEYIQFEDLLRHTRNLTSQESCTTEDVFKAIRIYTLIVNGAKVNTKAVGHAARLHADVLLRGYKGVTRDYTKAIRLYQHAASVGDEMALVALGEIWQWGCEGVQQDELAALRLFMEAVQSRQADVRCRAGVNLAFVYEENRQKRLRKGSKLEGRCERSETASHGRKALRRYLKMVPWGRLFFSAHR